MTQRQKELRRRRKRLSENRFPKRTESNKIRTSGPMGYVPGVLAFRCPHCGQHPDLCVCQGNRYSQRMDNS